MEITKAVSEILVRAYTVGAETSLGELSRFLELDSTSRLTAAIAIKDFTDRLKLELVPPVTEGEFDSLRVLRLTSSSADPVSLLRKLIAQGEGPAIEFKSSMLCSIRDWTSTGKRVELPSLEGELLKTVCAFLNGEGGNLIVGVADDGTICNGLQLDLELKGWTLDRWQLHFQSLITGRFHDGALVQPYVRANLLTLDNVSVFHVAVMPRQTRSFVRRSKGQAYEFFVRNGPRTDSLDYPSFYAHVLTEYSKQ